MNGKKIFYENTNITITSVKYSATHIYSMKVLYFTSDAYEIRWSMIDVTLSLLIRVYNISFY